MSNTTIVSFEKNGSRRTHKKLLGARAPSPCHHVVENHRSDGCSVTRCRLVQRRSEAVALTVLKSNHFELESSGQFVMSPNPALDGEDGAGNLADAVSRLAEDPTAGLQPQDLSSH